MARKVTTHVLCDVCLHEEDVEVEATETPPITLGQLKPRMLGLCDRHMKVYEDFRLLVQDLGQPVPEGGPLAPSRKPTPSKGRRTGTSPGSGIHPCPDPECPKHSDPFRHEQSLRNHARQVHGTNVPDLKSRFPQEGDPDPQDYLPLESGTAREPVVKEAPCPECGIVYAWPETVRPTVALGVHRAKAHGVRGATKKPKKG